MTSTGQTTRNGSGRFGAATPGARPQLPGPEQPPGPPAGPPGSRRVTRSQVIAGAVLAAVAALGYVAGHFSWTQAPPPAVGLMVTDTALPAGATLTWADLRDVPVPAGAAAPAGAVTRAAARGLVGLVTTQPVPAGTFLERALVGPSGALPDQGQALVGLALKPGQLPGGGLAVGQHVQVVLLQPNAQQSGFSPEPIGPATVWYVQPSDSATGLTQVAVIVPARQAVQLASFAAGNDVALVVTPQPGIPGAARPAPPPAATTARPVTPSPGSPVTRTAPPHRT
jgi:hypothetical protein